MNSEIIAAIRAKMAELAAAYPQYVGHFDNYVPVRVLSTVKTKMGVAFVTRQASLSLVERNVWLTGIAELREKAEQ